MFGNSVLRTKLAHANILQTKQAKTGLIRNHIKTDNQVPTIAKKPRKSRLFKNLIRQDITRSKVPSALLLSVGCGFDSRRGRLQTN